MNNHLKDLVICLVLLSVIVSVATAGVYQYFGMINNNVEVKQTLDIDGKDWNDYIIINTSLYSGQSYSDSFNINNNAPDINANISTYISGLPSGMNLTFYHNSVQFDFPIQLNATESYSVGYTLSTDLNLKPANYTVRIYFEGTEI